MLCGHHLLAQKPLHQYREVRSQSKNKRQEHKHPIEVTRLTPGGLPRHALYLPLFTPQQKFKDTTNSNQTMTFLLISASSFEMVKLVGDAHFGITEKTLSPDGNEDIQHSGYYQKQFITLRRITQNINCQEIQCFPTARNKVRFRSIYRSAKVNFTSVKLSSCKYWATYIYNNVSLLTGDIFQDLQQMFETMGIVMIPINNSLY